MSRDRFIRIFRHPAFALAGAALFALAAVALVRGGMAAGERLAAADDPVQITDQALDRVFNQGVAEREIRDALAKGDVDLAQSFVELAADRGVSIDPPLADQVKQARTDQGSIANTAGRFVHGLWTGEPADLASLAGTAFGDLFVFGDIRDAAREGTRYLTGQKYDPWIFGLAGVGLAITAGTYATLGAGAPERVGLSIVKAARRTGRLNPVLAVRAVREAVKVEEAGGLVELAENAGRVETKAGTQAALDSLAVAEEPQDMSRLARLAAAKGGKTRAIIKLLGRAAIVLTASALDLALWLFWAAFALLGFCSSCKAATERMTLRYLRWRKARRGYAAA
ncbi:MAG TPA: hypothetical protein VMR17_15950 [Xanthobacteraceae bacterium]|jgi:hypothetical protein|nr:hypothetical protein [Xanthobacteraceae bacterium]